MAISVANAMTHARSFIKAPSTYASAEELRMANTVQGIISSYHRWHWNTTAGTGIAIALAGQDYTMNAADQNNVLAIQNAYLAGASTKYADLCTWGDYPLPLTDTTGRPTSVCLMSGTAVRFWPASDASYTMTWRYYKRPTVFTVNTETWDCPEPFADVVKAGMIWQVLDWGDYVQADKWQKTFYDLLELRKVSERYGMGRTR
jgi:hypothetical protein